MDMSKYVLRYDLRGMLVDAADSVDGVLIDPTDAPQDMANEERDIEELMAWWRRPYIQTRGATFVVLCLDGGAWDRSTMIGHSTDLAEAVEIAKAYRPKASVVHVHVG